LLTASVFVEVGQPCEDEDPLPLVAGSHLSCLKSSPDNIIPQRGKRSEYGFKSEPNKSWDVLTNEPSGLNLAKDSLNVIPEPALVVHPSLFSCCAEGLTRESRRDDIHDATPWFAVKGGNVIPDRSLIQGRFFHARHKSGRCVTFPLNVTYGSYSTSEGGIRSEFETTVSGK